MKKRSPINFLALRTLKRIILLSFIIAIFSQITFADDKIVVENLLKEKIDNIIVTLKNKDLNDESKEQKVEEVINPIINYPLMSMLVLGKENWKSLPEKDQKRFIELFAKTIKQTLISKILNFVDEEIIIDASDQAGKKKVNISTSIVTKEKKIPVMYMFYRSGNEWNIYDVEIEGVSIVRNFKAQYADKLEDMTPEELIARMEKSDSQKSDSPN